MKLKDFNFVLPERLIADYPLQNRSDSRLMIIDPTQPFNHLKVSDLPFLLHKGDVIVANNTKVFPARLLGIKATGGRVEVLIERLFSANSIRAFVKCSGVLRDGSRLLMDGGFELKIIGRDNDLFLLDSDCSVDILKMAVLHGCIPLPPYINRESNEIDRSRYQTVFAKDIGAVAAPTAGLHFDKELIDAMKTVGALWCEVTLHIGAGTFKPVRVNDLKDHKMHAEWYHIPSDVCETIKKAKANGRRIIAIGTTTMRCLEGSAALNGGQIKAGSAETSVFITPGYQFNVIDVLFTNFHLPKSTLLMLVSAFGGYERIMAAYREAISENYRFFSYGDACLIINHRETSHAP